MPFNQNTLNLSPQYQSVVGNALAGQYRPAGNSGGFTSTGTNLFFPSSNQVGGTPLGQQPPFIAAFQQQNQPQAQPQAQTGGDDWAAWNPQPQQQPQQQTAKQTTPAPKQATQQAPAQQDVTIGTSIQPQDIYPEQYINQAANLAATGVPAYNDLVAGRQLPGISVQSPVTQAGMGADLGAALAQALMSRSGIQQQLGFGNAQNQLLGEVGRDNEAQNLMSLLANNQGAAQNNQLMQDQSLMQFLSTMFRLA